MENNNEQFPFKNSPTSFPDKITKTLDGISKIEKAQKEAEAKAKKQKSPQILQKQKVRNGH